MARQARTYDEGVYRDVYYNIGVQNDEVAASQRRCDMVVECKISEIKYVMFMSHELEHFKLFRT